MSYRLLHRCGHVQYYSDAALAERGPGERQSEMCPACRERKVYPTAFRAHPPQDLAPRLHLMKSDRYCESLCGRHCAWLPAPADAAPLCPICERIRDRRERRKG